MNLNLIMYVDTRQHPWRTYNNFMVWISKNPLRHDILLTRQVSTFTFKGQPFFVLNTQFLYCYLSKTLVHTFDLHDLQPNFTWKFENSTQRCI